MTGPRSIHLAFAHVRASEDRNAVEAVSAYIRDGMEGDMDRATSVEAVLAYLRATGRHEEKDSRVVATQFLCEGPLGKDRVWTGLDRSFRTKSGAYSKRVGNRRKRGQEHKSSGRARLAIFGDAAFPHDMAEEEKLEASRRLGEAIKSKYGCAVELAWHAKDGRIDHVHLLASTKTVDEGGIGLRTIREFNGIASRCAGNCAEDGALVAGFVEFARQTYAQILTEMTGVLYDPRSFRRQGRSEKPAPWIFRGTLEEEARDGTFTSMKERKKLLAQRAAEQASASYEIESSGAHPAPGESMPNMFVTPPSNPILGLIGTVGTKTKTPTAAQHTTLRNSSKELAEARTLEEIAEIIAADVHADAKNDSLAFAQEQKAAEARRLAQLLDNLPAPGTSWFGLQPKEAPKVLAPHLRTRRQVKDAEPGIAKTQVPFVEPAPIQIRSTDKPFDEDEESVYKKRTPSAMSRSERVDGDPARTSTILHSQKTLPPRRMAKPSFMILEEGHLVGRLVPRKGSSTLPVQSTDAGTNVAKERTCQAERNTSTHCSIGTLRY